MNSTLSCDICKSAVGLIDAEVNASNTTVAALSIIVKAACAVFAGSIGRHECDFIVDNIKNIISMLDKGMNHIQICEFLHLCKKKYGFFVSDPFGSIFILF